MIEERTVKIQSRKNPKISLKVIPGHFATSHSHISHYIDMTTLRVRHTEAKEVAKTLAKNYKYNTIIDTIIWMDGCECIGTELANELTEAGIMVMNFHQSLYVITPEFDPNGQLIFRDNLQPMVKGKNILLLVASTTTGKTIAQSLECIQYYGGKVQGIAAIFSAVSEIYGHEVNAIFHANDLPDYKAYKQGECPDCKANKPIDAIVNGHGYSKL